MRGKVENQDLRVLLVQSADQILRIELRGLIVEDNQARAYSGQRGKTLVLVLYRHQLSGCRSDAEQTRLQLTLQIAVA